MAGEGAALGYAHVTAGLIDQGLLAPLGPWAYQTGQGYHLVWSNRSALSENAAIVRDWIAEAATRAGATAPAQS